MKFEEPSKSFEHGHSENTKEHEEPDEDKKPDGKNPIQLDDTADEHYGENLEKEVNDDDTSSIAPLSCRAMVCESPCRASDEGIFRIVRHPRVHKQVIQPLSKHSFTCDEIEG